MQRVFALVFGIALCASPVFAQGGMITLFADPGGADCAINDTQAGVLIRVYVFHVLAPEALGSEFSVPMPSCAVGMIWLGDSAVFPVTVHESPTGVGIGYGVCYTEAVHILTINFYGVGTSLNCCPLRVEPPWWGNPPDPPGVNMVDCEINLIPAVGGVALINPDETCPCLSVPTQETTWGKVKAIYAK